MKWFNKKKDQDHSHVAGGPSATPRLRDHVRELFDSTHKRISRGAENIVKMIPYAHKDNWRKTENHHRKPK